MINMETLKLDLSKLIYDAIQVFSNSGYFTLTDIIGGISLTGIFTEKKQKKEQILQIKQWFNDWVDENVK